MKDSGVSRQKALVHQGLVLEIRGARNLGVSGMGVPKEQMTEGQTPFSLSCLHL